MAMVLAGEHHHDVCRLAASTTAAVRSPGGKDCGGPSGQRTLVNAPNAVCRPQTRAGHRIFLGFGRRSFADPKLSRRNGRVGVGSAEGMRRSAGGFPAGAWEELWTLSEVLSSSVSHCVAIGSPARQPPGRICTSREQTPAKEPATVFISGFVPSGEAGFGRKNWSGQLFYVKARSRSEESSGTNVSTTGWLVVVTFTEDLSVSRREKATKYPEQKRSSWSTRAHRSEAFDLRSRQFHMQLYPDGGRYRNEFTEPIWRSGPCSNSHIQPTG